MLVMVEGCWSWLKGVVYGQKVLVIADGCWGVVHG